MAGILLLFRVFALVCVRVDNYGIPDLFLMSIFQKVNGGFVSETGRECR